MDSAQWRKSTFSGDTGNSDCVEVALDQLQAAVRDSKNSAGPRLLVPFDSWRSFLSVATVPGPLRPPSAPLS
nr:DUF397 domain-containing protein [Labedaea rhizosphaerae]